MMILRNVKFASLYIRVTAGKSASRTVLDFTIPWANSADDKLELFFVFFTENRMWHFIQISSIGDDLHEMTNPVF